MHFIEVVKISTSNRGHANPACTSLSALYLGHVNTLDNSPTSLPSRSPLDCTGISFCALSNSSTPHRIGQNYNGCVCLSCKDSAPQSV